MQSDLLVLWDGSEIVGAYHRLRQPWCLDGQRITIPALHDLAVLPNYRRGEGLQLILAALAGETHVALFGLTGVSDEIYNRMRVPGVELFWLEKDRNPLAAGLRALKAKAQSPKERSVSEQKILRNGYEFRLISTPSEANIREALSVPISARAYVDWDFPSFRWRFFDENGPRNILLLARSGTRISGRAVLSTGLRHRLLVGRVVDMVTNELECRNAMIEIINKTFSELKIPFAFLVTSSRELADAWTMRGWSNRKNPPGARWFSRNKSAAPQPIWIQGGAWDFGCDKRVGG
jgi:hypothetical protein